MGMPHPPTNQLDNVLGFELWDKETRNALGGFDTEVGALAAVAEAVAIHGADYANSIVLLRVGPRGGLKRIAGGQDLVVRARKAAASAAARVAIESQPQGSPTALLAHAER